MGNQLINELIKCIKPMKSNFKEKLNQVKLNLLAGIFFLGIIIFYVGLDGNLLFVLIGIIILLQFLIWFLITHLKERKVAAKKKTEIEKLKKYGEKVILNLEKVKITSNSWQQEIRKTSRYEDKLRKVNINYNLIEFKILYRSGTIDYSVHVNMDKTKLRCILQ